MRRPFGIVTSSVASAPGRTAPLLYARTAGNPARHKFQPNGSAYIRSVSLNCHILHIFNWGKTKSTTTMGNNNQLKQKCLILAILGISSYCCYLSLVSNADFRSTTVRGTRNALRKESQTGSSQHQNILPPSETDPVEEQKREQQCKSFGCGTSD